MKATKCEKPSPFGFLQTVPQKKSPNTFLTKSRSLFNFADLSSAAIKNVSLMVDPPAVRRGQHATLHCAYDLDSKPLYSVKFYRGSREFYRYSPSELPTSKIFAFPGINVDVSICYIKLNFDESNSHTHKHVECGILDSGMSMMCHCIWSQ